MGAQSRKGAEKALKELFVDKTWKFYTYHFDRNGDVTRTTVEGADKGLE